MIRHLKTPPGGSGLVPMIIRLWWTLINLYYTHRWLACQLLVPPRRFILSRTERRQGLTAVVTGGSRGIGAAVVQRFLEYNMHVIIGCRNTSRGLELVKDIRRKGITTGKVDILPLDLTSLNSIKEFAYKIIKKDINLNILVNNAGVKAGPYGITVEGLEQHYQINYLGHFLLTHLLLPKLSRSSSEGQFNSRIIHVTSTDSFGAYPHILDPEDTLRLYSPEKSYMDSKLMQIVHSNFLDETLKTSRSSVRSFAVHPGFVKTDLWKEVWWVKKIGPFHHLLFHRADQAAETIAYAALSPQLEDSGGLFFVNNEPLEPHPMSMDKNFQFQLWKHSCEDVKIQTRLWWIENTSEVVGGQSTKCDDEQLDSDEKTQVPYYEFFITNLFKNLNIKKSWMIYLECYSILLLQRLDRFSSQFKVKLSLK